jgi:hypothetical protein
MEEAIKIRRRLKLFSCHDDVLHIFFPRIGSTLACNWSLFDRFDPAKFSNLKSWGFAQAT